VSVRPWGAGPVQESLERLNATPEPPHATEDEKRRRKQEKADLERELNLWEDFATLIGLTEDFNGEAARLLSSSQGTARVDQCFATLFAGGHSDTAALEKVDKISQRWCRLYAVAGALAQQWQAKFKRDWVWMFALGFTGFLCFEMFAHLAPLVEHWPPVLVRTFDVALLAVYVLAFLAIFIIFAVARWHQHQERFLDYWALAEAVRVSVFWKLNDIGSVADAYPIKLPSELAWVKKCLLKQEMLDAADDLRPTTPDPWSYDWTRRIWVQGQFYYFDDKSRSHHNKAEWRENLSIRILSLAFFVAVLFFLAHAISSEPSIWWRYPPRELPWHIHDLVIFSIGLLPGLAAIFVGYAEQLVFKAQSRQFDRMRELFGRALELLPCDPVKVDRKRARDLFRELGTEVMRDNAEWVANYRQRPIRPPQAG
jgi:hypothetical protein